MDKSILESNLTRVHDWIKSADEKVNIWIAFQGILIALITPYLSEKVIPVVYHKPWFVVGFFILASAIFFFSFFKSISAITPRLKSKPGKKSLIYFGHIAEMGFEDFKRKIDQYSEKDYIDELKNQIFVSSKIALKKHSEFRVSVLTLFVSIVLFIPVFFYLNF